MGFLPIVFLEKGPPSSVSFVARKMHAGDSKDHSVVIDLRQDACCSSPFLDRWRPLPILPIWGAGKSTRGTKTSAEMKD